MTTREAERAMLELCVKEEDLEHFYEALQTFEEEDNAKNSNNK